MPFKAAKALALNFCWSIRFALVPIFGPSFPDDCTHPEHPLFKRFTIDNGIIQDCTREAEGWKATRRRSRAKCRLPNLPSLSPMPMPTPTPTPSFNHANIKALRPRAIVTYNVDLETSSQSSDDKIAIPSGRAPTTSAVGVQAFPSPQSLDDLSPSSWSTSPPLCKMAFEKSHTKRNFTELNKRSAKCNSIMFLDVDSTKMKKRKVGKFDSNEARAAYALLQLHAADGRVCH